MKKSTKFKFINDNKVFFIGEKLPYIIKASSERYVIVSRKFHRRSDANLLHDRVKMGTYFTFTEALYHNKDNYVYSIIDLKENIRGTDNYIFSMFDYFDEIHCQEAISYLEKNEMSISTRNRVVLDIDWNRM